MNKKLIKFVKIGGFEWEINDWGSVQYAGALASFNAFFKTRHDTNTHLQELESNFGIIVNMEKFFKNDLAIQNFRMEMKRFMNCKDKLKLLTNIGSGDDMFNFCKNCAFDLWGAASIISKCYNIDVKIIDDEPRSNYQTGILCALLFDKSMVKNNKSFANFDT